MRACANPQFLEFGMVSYLQTMMQLQKKKMVVCDGPII